MQRLFNIALASVALALASAALTLASPTLALASPTLALASAALALASAALVLVSKVMLPFFRGGNEVPPPGHFAAAFTAALPNAAAN